MNCWTLDAFRHFVFHIAGGGVGCARSKAPDSRYHLRYPARDPSFTGFNVASLCLYNIEADSETVRARIVTLLSFVTEKF